MSFDFLALPPEIRVRIYRQVLVSPPSIFLEPNQPVITSADRGSSHRHRMLKQYEPDLEILAGKSISEQLNTLLVLSVTGSHSSPYWCPGILRVSRQVHAESVHVLYWDNAFCVDEPCSQRQNLEDYFWEPPAETSYLSPGVVSVLYGFLRNIGQSNARLVRSLSMPVPLLNLRLPETLNTAVDWPLHLGLQVFADRRNNARLLLHHQKSHMRMLSSLAPNLEWLELTISDIFSSFYGNPGHVDELSATLKLLPKLKEVSFLIYKTAGEKSHSDVVDAFDKQGWAAEFGCALCRFGLHDSRKKYTLPEDDDLEGCVDFCYHVLKETKKRKKRRRSTFGRIKRRKKTGSKC